MFFIQWVLQVMLPSACSFIVDVSCHCFTLTKCKTLKNNIYNKAARWRQHNLQNPLNNSVQQDAKIWY
jgi:hypothetical protein